MGSEILKIHVNEIRTFKGQAPLAQILGSDRLRADYGFDSLDLAELTARIHERYQIDIFADGLTDSVAEIARRLDQKDCRAD